MLKYDVITVITIPIFQMRKLSLRDSRNHPKVACLENGGGSIRAQAVSARLGSPRYLTDTSFPLCARGTSVRTNHKTPDV